MRIIPPHDILLNDSKSAVTFGVWKDGELRLLDTNFKLPFHAILGHTPVEEVRSVRLDLTARLLRDTQTPVDSIGDFCGFKTLSDLKSAFKRKFVVSMRAYRRKPLVPSSR